MSSTVSGARARRSTATAARDALCNQFDPEVIAFMRAQFDAADTDGSGEIDSAEAAQLLAKLGGGGATEAERLRSAENLIRSMDSDRNGTLNFEEFCFRFAAPGVHKIHCSLYNWIHCKVEVVRSLTSAEDRERKRWLAEAFAH